MLGDRIEVYRGEAFTAKSQWWLVRMAARRLHRPIRRLVNEPIHGRILVGMSFNPNQLRNKMASAKFRGKTVREWHENALLARLMLLEPLSTHPGWQGSPIVGKNDWELAGRPQPPISGIDFRFDEQVELIQDLTHYWGGVPDVPTDGWRYHSSMMFQPPDAMIYHAMLRHFRPKRVIESGSGFTSALALDTKDRYLPDLELTFIEPHPDHRLDALIGQEDRSNCEIYPLPIQDVSLNIFDQLEAGDFLFADTAHIAKAGSEVNWIVFNILPRLPAGVIVHFHDVFWPFEYPKDWLEDGRSYNEIYMLRALMMYNETFEMLLFCNWAWKERRELFDVLPNSYSGGPPGSLWLRKRR